MTEPTHNPNQPMEGSAQEARHRAAGQGRAEQALENVNRTLAAVQGALEGLQDALEHEDVGSAAGAAAREARATYEYTREEVRDVARSPEMQQAGSSIRSGAHAVGDRARAAGDRARAAGSSVADDVREVRDDVAHTIHAARERVRETADDVGRKAGAVRESATRASHAPGRILDDVKRGVAGWSSRIAAALGMFVAAGALAVVVLVLLAIWLTVALNEVLGNPLGTLVSAIIFGLATLGLAMLARSRMQDASERMKRARDEVREDIDYVKQPVRREFGARRGA